MTTTVGIVGKDFVILAADKLASMGDLAFDLRISKIIPVSDHIALTTAGSVGDTQVLARFLRARIKRLKIERGEEPTVESVANFLALFLNNNRFFPYLAELVIGGYVEKPFAATVDPVGGLIPVTDYTATGSGCPVAFGVLEEGYSDGITEKKAIELAVKAVESARRRNLFTGGREPGIDVAVINSKGVRMLSPEEVLRIK